MELLLIRIFKIFFISTLSMMTLISCKKEIAIQESKEELVEKIQTYQDSIKIISKSGEFDTATFNLRTYLGFFDKIHLRSGKQCRLLYLGDMLGARPIFRSVGDSFDLHKYIVFMDKKYTDSPLYYEQTREHFAEDSTIMACNNMIPEDSQRGYVQYLFFHEMGEQFALYWHAMYLEKSVICTKVNLDKIYNRYKHSDRFWTNKRDLDLFSNVNPEISVKMETDRCIITWYEIHTHLGIYKRTYSIQRSAPYLISRIKDETMVLIVCNFIY